MKTEVERQEEILQEIEKLRIGFRCFVLGLFAVLMLLFATNFAWWGYLFHIADEQFMSASSLIFTLGLFVISLKAVQRADKLQDALE